MNRLRPHVYPLDPLPEAAVEVARLTRHGCNRHSMRSFDDERGGHWQAALMEASFGNVLLVLTKIGAEGVLRAPLDAANFREAQAWLAGADEERLRALLAEAKPWN
jgi:hypothetical protein